MTRLASTLLVAAVTALLAVAALYMASAADRARCASLRAAHSPTVKIRCGGQP